MRKDRKRSETRCKINRRRKSQSQAPCGGHSGWCQTAVPKKGNLVFYTTKGNPFVRNVLKIDANGNEKYSPINSIATKFARMIKKAGLEVPKGTGFYTLRRTAATLAARSGDPFAVQRLLGHANLLMTTRYVQDASKQTDQVIGKSRDFLGLSMGYA